jgi:tetratricopeptide (TPR) repeat protein
MHLFSVHDLEFPLKSRRRAGLFLALAVLVTLVGSAEAVKIAVVTTLAQSAEVSYVQKTLAFDPANPALHSRLSQLDGVSPEPANLARALAEARRATALAPNHAGYWLNLASTCESVYDNTCADQAFERALVLSPMVPEVWWAAGNHYLRSDRPQAALPCFHRLLELSPDYAAPTFDLALRAFGDPKMILQTIVGDKKDPRALLAFVDFMSAQHQFSAAQQAWTQLARGGSQFPFAAVQPYLERLLTEGRYQEAQAVWSSLEVQGLVAQPADREPGNLVFNGGFEQPPIGAGFDWRAQPSSFASMDFADASPYAGAHCLRIDFPVAQNDEFEPVYQFVPVVPGQSYTLAAYVRSRDITSDSGPRLRVTDPACPSCLDASTDTTLGSTEWHKVTLTFSAGPRTQAVRVSIWRPRSRVFPMEISGSFWLDAVCLRATGGVVPKAGV